ncbi:replication initiation regulator SeqA [Motilimonas sp. KMU-193]|uniref:replication initiation regulator SeqA n=1 Tax=Motilimonas sp. KMU-193 TaxID=3388668 RepID=UPI00396B16AA
MKKIELDDELYQYIAAQTQNIGESASQILRRLLSLPPLPNNDRANVQPSTISTNNASTESATAQHDSDTKRVEKANADQSDVNVNDVQSNVASHAKDTSAASDSLPDATGLQALLDSHELSTIEHSVERFLLMLSAMYQDSPSAFAKASETTRGRKRLYLAASETALEEGGKTCKPRAIADTPFWVITNANNGRKRIIIAQLMASMGYAHHVIEKACAKI